MYWHQNRLIFALVIVGMENKEKVKHRRIKELTYMTTIVTMVVTRLLGKMAALITLEKVHKVKFC